MHTYLFTWAGVEQVIGEAAVLFQARICGVGNVVAEEETLVYELGAEVRSLERAECVEGMLSDRLGAG